MTATRPRPRVSFIIPTLNAQALLDGCLQSIRRQRYPQELVEVLVMDGGSTDRTTSIAEAYGARVVPNPHRLAEPGVALGQQVAAGELHVVMAADNELPSERWLSLMTACFEDSNVGGAYTHVMNSPTDPRFCRYVNLMHADPFNWFVYGAAVDPRRFRDVFPVRRRDGYEIYQFRGHDRPLIALAQAFVIRAALSRPGDSVNDDILPIWDLIDASYELAYVPEAGVYHHTLRSFPHFVRKFRTSIRRNLDVDNAGSLARRALLSAAQRRRQYLWFLYSFSVLFPLIDALRGWRRDRDPAWLYHPLACGSLSIVMLSQLLRAGIQHLWHGAIQKRHAHA